MTHAMPYHLRVRMRGEEQELAHVLHSSDPWVLMYEEGSVVHTTTPAVLLPTAVDGFYRIERIEGDHLAGGIHMTTVWIEPAEGLPAGDEMPEFVYNGREVAVMHEPGSQSSTGGAMWMMRIDDAFIVGFPETAGETIGQVAERARRRADSFAAKTG